MALTAQDKADIVEIVRAVIADAPAEDAPKQARASSTAKVFPYARTHKCAAKGRKCKRISKTAEGAATHLAEDAPRNAKGHTPIW